MKSIPFSPPDITQKEIDLVVEVLKSGWITTGPKTAEFEEKLQEFCQCDSAVTLSSATAGMELILKNFDIKEGDEVITTAYTYTATASVILHRGAKPVFVDVKEGSFLIDKEKLKEAITPKTKAIITVDVAGVPVDYDGIREILKEKGREDIIFISDSAHSLGAKYKGKRVGSQADFHVFSFHAVKNLTTVEGGAITFNNKLGMENLKKQFKIHSLHGQTKDALSKMKAGAWKYDIVTDGFKCNMTDLNAAIGLGQLGRYEKMLYTRKQIFDIYSEVLKDKEWAEIPFSKDDTKETSYHLFLLRLKNFTEDMRNNVIVDMAEKNIATNVHYRPLPLLTLYKNLGYKMEDYKNAYNQYVNEISLPIYSTLTLEDAKYVVEELVKSVEKFIE